MPTLSSSGRRTAAVFAAASALVPLAAGSAHAEAPAAPPKLHGEPGGGGGLLGGGTYNNSVDLILNWRSSSGHTFCAQHAVFYEECWNGSGALPPDAQRPVLQHDAVLRPVPRLADRRARVDDERADLGRGRQRDPDQPLDQ